jgi:hypothetical protein
MKKSMMYITFIFVVLGYSLLYVFYNMVINLLHSSFSIVSVPAIVVPCILLVLVAFKVWKMREKSKKKKAKKFLITLVIFTTIPVIYLMIQLGINEFNSRFSQEKWQDRLDERVHMVDHLLNKYRLAEMNKEEVYELLGKPTETEYFREQNNIVYYLGPERGFISIDSEWLVIWFDNQDKVIEYKILRD